MGLHYTSYDYTFKRLRQTGNASDVDIWAAPGSGKRIYITAITVTGDTAGTITVTDGADAAGTRLWDLYNVANGGINEVFPVEIPLRLSDNTALKLTTTGGGNYKVVVRGFEA